MKKLLKPLRIVAEIICYIALALILFSIATIAYVETTHVCQTNGFVTQVCDTPFIEEVANFSSSVILLTVFTGLPGLLALGGVFFILRHIHHRQTMRLRAEGRDDEVIKLRFFLLKAMLYLMGAVLAFGFVGGIISSLNT